MGIFHSTVDGNLVDANPAFAAMFGYTSPQEILDTVNGRGGTPSLYEEPEQRDAMIRQVRIRPPAFRT